MLNYFSFKYKLYRQNYWSCCSVYNLLLERCATVNCNIYARGCVFRPKLIRCVVQVFLEFLVFLMESIKSYNGIHLFFAVVNYCFALRHIPRILQILVHNIYKWLLTSQKKVTTKLNLNESTCCIPFVFHSWSICFPLHAHNFV